MPVLPRFMGVRPGTAPTSLSGRRRCPDKPSSSRSDWPRADAGAVCGAAGPTAQPAAGRAAAASTSPQNRAPIPKGNISLRRQRRRHSRKRAEHLMREMTMSALRSGRPVPDATHGRNHLRVFLLRLGRTLPRMCWTESNSSARLDPRTPLKTRAMRAITGCQTPTNGVFFEVRCA